MTANRMRTLIIVFFSIISLNSFGQKTFLGDHIFQSNKEKEIFEFDANNSIVRIGNLVNDKSKHAIIFQQIDSINYLWELKLMSYRMNKIVEKVIDTMDMGILVDLQFIDKDFDNNRDLVITISGNKVVDFLYMYDEQKNTLRPVKGFINYPETKQAGTSKFWYSYKAAGCADNYWHSNLIKIQNFQVKEYGEIVGNGCEDEEEGNRIKISAFSEQEFQVNYDTLKHFNNNKWQFIQQYWSTKVTERNE